MQAAPGYMGFRRVQDGDPVSDKPGDSAYVRDRKFEVLAEKAPRPNLHRGTATSLNTDAMATVKPGDYVVPHRKGVMKDKEAQLPRPCKFIAASASSAAFVDYRKQLETLASFSEADLKAAFDAHDKDGSGFIEGREMASLLRWLHKKEEVPEREMRLFLAYFDDNKDGKVSWDEFKNGVAKVVHAMEVETRPKGGKKLGPSWQQRPDPVCIGPGIRKSSQMTDVGDAGEAPSERKLTDGSGMASTTRDLFEGTSKRTLQLPGYGGFIPQATMGKKFAGNAVDQASGEAIRDSFHTKTNLILTIQGAGMSGYTGHRPSAAEHMSLARTTVPPGATEKSAADAIVLDYWKGRSGFGAAGGAGSE